MDAISSRLAQQSIILGKPLEVTHKVLGYLRFVDFRTLCAISLTFKNVTMGFLQRHLGLLFTAYVTPLTFLDIPLEVTHGILGYLSFVDFRALRATSLVFKNVTEGFLQRHLDLFTDYVTLSTKAPSPLNLFNRLIRTRDGNTSPYCKMRNFYHRAIEGRIVLPRNSLPIPTNAMLNPEDYRNVALALPIQLAGDITARNNEALQKAWPRIRSRLEGLNELPADDADIISIKNFMYAHQRELRAIEALDLSRLELLDVFPELQFFNLKSLNLSKNKIARLPAFMGNMEELKQLNLSKNPLTTEAINTSPLANLKNLTHLDLKSLNLRSFPLSITRLKQLTHLTIGKQEDGIVLPPEIGLLTNLIYLDISKANLTTLPNEIGNLTNLEYLNLNYNFIGALPSPHFGKLTQLKRFEFIYGHLAAWPMEIGQLTELTHLDLSLSETNLGILPASAFENATKLTYLNLRYSKVQGLPANELEKLTMLQYLDLGQNQLNDIPEGEIGRLENLQYLYLRSNPLTRLSGEMIQKLKNLKFLDIESNKIDVISESISRLL